VHPLPIVRYYAAVALEQILGTACPIDLHQDNARIQADAQKWLTQSGMAAPPVATPTTGSVGSGSDEE